MALPTSYSESTLAVYMHGVLGGDGSDVARELNWSVAGGDYKEAVFETAFAYGTDDVSSISGRDNLRKLRMIARRELWRLVMQRTAHKVDTQASVEGGGESHSQLNQHAKEQFVLASAEVERAYPDVADGWSVGVTPTAYGDPYAHDADSDDEWSRVN